MYGIDISNIQSKIDLSKGNYDFAIIKATEGINFVDKSFSRYAKELSQLNKLIGCYHFARPDLHSTVGQMEAEARNFTNAVATAGLTKKAILVLDWERNGDGNPKELINAFCKFVHSILGYYPIIYCNSYFMSQSNLQEVLNKYKCWVAQWPCAYFGFTVGEKINENIPSTSDIKPIIWQYTSKGTFPEYTGNVDLDYSILSVDDWRILAGEDTNLKGADETISADMEWAINKGLFNGYSDGTYHPTEPLTRQAAASLFRRFYQIIEYEFIKS